MSNRDSLTRNTSKSPNLRAQAATQSFSKTSRNQNSSNIENKFGSNTTNTRAQSPNQRFQVKYRQEDISEKNQQTKRSSGRHSGVNIHTNIQGLKQPSYQNMTKISNEYLQNNQQIIIKRMKELQCQNYKLQSINKTNQLRLQLIGNKILQVQKQKQYTKKQNQRLQARIEALQSQLQLQKIKKQQTVKQHNQEMLLFQDRNNKFSMLKNDYKKLQQQNRELKEKLYVQLKNQSKQHQTQLENNLSYRNNSTTSQNKSNHRAHLTPNPKDFTSANNLKSNDISEFKYKGLQQSEGRKYNKNIISSNSPAVNNITGGNTNSNTNLGMKFIPTTDSQSKLANYNKSTIANITSSAGSNSIKNNPQVDNKPDTDNKKNRTYERPVFNSNSSNKNLTSRNAK